MDSEGAYCKPWQASGSTVQHLLWAANHMKWHLLRAQLFQMLKDQKKLILGRNHHKLTLLNIPWKVQMPNVIKEFSKDTDVQGPCK
jgi:hypothetical protein